MFFVLLLEAFLEILPWFLLEFKRRFLPHTHFHGTPPPWGRYPLLGADHTRQKSRPHLPEEQIGKFRHRLSPGPETILATRTLDWGPTCVLPLFSQCSPTLFPNPSPILINMSYPPTQAEPPAGPKAMLYTRSPASNLNEDSLLNQRSYRP